MVACQYQVVKPYLRPDLAAAHPHPNSFSITLIQPLSFLTFTHSSAQRTNTYLFFFQSLAHSFHRDGGVGATPSPSLPTFPRVYELSLLFHIIAPLLHFFALTKNTTPLFQSFPHSAPRNTGWEVPRFLRSTFRGDYHAPNKSPACPTLSGHESPVTSLAIRTIRRTAFGATIRKGTRNLYDPGKQLRSPGV